MSGDEGLRCEISKFLGKGGRVAGLEKVRVHGSAVPRKVLLPQTGFGKIWKFLMFNQKSHNKNPLKGNIKKKKIKKNFISENDLANC